MERPTAEVFAYLTEPTNLPEWQASALQARAQGEGPLGVGTRIVEKRRFLGRDAETTVEVTALEPERRFTICVVSGPLPFTIDHRLEPVEGGTRLSVVAEGEPGGVIKLAAPLVVRAVKQETRQNFTRLKEILEARS